MLGFTTSNRPIRVGDVIMDNTSMYPWGPSPAVVLSEISIEAARERGLEVPDDCKVLLVRVYSNNDRIGDKTWVVNDRFRVVNATIDEVLEERARRRRVNPRWTKDQSRRYSELVAQLNNLESAKYCEAYNTAEYTKLDLEAKDARNLADRERTAENVRILTRLQNKARKFVHEYCAETRNEIKRRKAEFKLQCAAENGVAERDLAELQAANPKLR